MASRKQKRYGAGGFKHKRTPNVDRPNGKAWKKHPKGFTRRTRRLVTNLVGGGGTTGNF